MNAERMFHVAGVAVFVFYVPLCLLAWYTDVSTFLPVVLVLSSVGSALLLCADMLRGERERQAFLDELREREAEFRTKRSKLEESQ